MAATYDDLVFFCFQWKKHSQSESESRIHWLKSRRNTLNRRYLVYRESNNLQETMLKNHLVGRFKVQQDFFPVALSSVSSGHSQGEKEALPLAHETLSFHIVCSSVHYNGAHLTFSQRA